MPTPESLWQSFIPKTWWDDARVITKNIQHEMSDRTSKGCNLSRKGAKYGKVIGKVGEIAASFMLNSLRIEHASLAWEVNNNKVRSDYADVILSGLRVDVITGEAPLGKIASDYALLVPKHKQRIFDLYFSMAIDPDSQKIYFMGWIPGNVVSDTPVSPDKLNGGPPWLKYPARIIHSSSLMTVEELTNARFVRSWRP